MCANKVKKADRDAYERAFTTALCPLREKIRRCYDQELSEFGLSRALAAPLVRIWEHDGLRQNALAGMLDVEGPTVVSLLDQLSAIGLVVRRPDPTDQRARTLHVTPAGAALAQRIGPLVERLRQRLLAGVSDADLQTALRVFDCFLAACESEGKRTAK
ncbi:MAG: MarR family transcriptional regulator [Gemmatimonadaceae bacterium]